MVAAEAVKYITILALCSLKMASRAARNLHRFWLAFWTIVASIWGAKLNQTAIMFVIVCWIKSWKACWIDFGMNFGSFLDGEGDKNGWKWEET